MLSWERRMWVGDKIKELAGNSGFNTNRERAVL